MEDKLEETYNRIEFKTLRANLIQVVLNKFVEGVLFQSINKSEFKFHKNFR